LEFFFAACKVRWGGRFGLIYFLYIYLSWVFFTIGSPKFAISLTTIGGFCAYNALHILKVLNPGKVLNQVHGILKVSQVLFSLCL